MRTNAIDNRDWNRNSYNVKRWCHVYQDRDTGETIKVKGFTSGKNEDRLPIIHGMRNDPNLMKRRLRYIGIGTVNVTGLETATTVPSFSYQSVDA